MVSLARLSKRREAASRPVELARVDDDTAERSTMPANPLGSGVHDDVSTVINRSNQETAHAEGVVDQERYTVLVRHIRDLLKRRDVELRVSDTLDVYGLGLLVDRSVECGRIIRSDELDMDTVLLQQDLELVVRAAVEV